LNAIIYRVLATPVTARTLAKTKGCLMSETSAAAGAAGSGGPGSQLVPQAAATTTTPSVTGGTQFTFVYNSITYDVQFYAPDANGQYGFSLTQTPSGSSTATPLASFIYAGPDAKQPVTAGSWEIKVSLPSSLQIGGLTLSQVSADIGEGTVSPLTAPS
jgi:hypothetical protein